MTINISNKKYSILHNQSIINQDITVTENGNYYPSDDYTGFNLVRVKVPEPNLVSKTISPKITSQTITPSTGIDGFNKVIVNPVTSAIDSNIKPENIVKNVKILGVTGNVEFTTEELEISPTIRKQTKTPTADGYSKVVVNAVTSAIDSNITSANIRKDVKILGVTGSIIESNETTRDIYANGRYTPPSPYTGFSEVNVDVRVEQDALTITPSTSEQVFTASDMYHGYSPVTVHAVTSNIDSNIKPENILKNVKILGVTGNVVKLVGQERTENVTGVTTFTPASGYNAITKIKVTPVTNPITITPTKSKQTINVPSELAGYGTITVNPVTASIDSNIIAANIKKDVTILGVEGTCAELSTTTLKVTENGVYSPSAPYNGYSQVTVDINTVNNRDLSVTNNGVWTPEAPYTGFEKVTVDVSSRLTELTVTPTDTVTTILPETNKLGFSKVVVDLTWIEDALQELNAGDTQTSINLQNKTFSSAGTYTCDSGYDGLGTVTINLDWVETAIEQARTQAPDGVSDDLIEGSAINISTDADRVRKYAFAYNSNLAKVILNNAQSIDEYAFIGTNLAQLYIYTPTKCVLNNINAFSTTPTIYVPSNLVATYRADTKWSNFTINSI